MGTKGNVDHVSTTKLAFKSGYDCGPGGAKQAPGHSIGTGHKKSATLSHHGGAGHQVGGGRGYLAGGKGIFGKK